MKKIKTILAINLTMVSLQYFVLMYLLLSLNLVNTSNTAYFGIYLICVVFTVLTIIVVKSVFKEYFFKVKEYRVFNK